MKYPVRKLSVSQGEPGTPDREWLHQRALGRLFGLNGAQMGKTLHLLGCRTENGSLSPHMIETGVARLVGGHNGSQPVTQWNTSKIKTLCEQNGIALVSREDVHLHAVIDRVATGLKGLMASEKTIRGSSSLLWAPDSWQRLHKSTVEFFLSGLKQDLAGVENNRHALFVDGLVEGLAAKRIPTPILREMLNAAGELPAYLAREEARTMEEQWKPSTMKASTRRI